MKLTRAVLSGLIGAVMVWIIVFVAGMIARTDSDLCVLSGASITGTATTWSWIAGAISQLILGAIASVVYAAIFEWVTRRAGATVGFVIGLAHAVVAGIGIGFLPAQQLITASVQPPAAFLEYRGWIPVIGFIVAHVAFGTLVGAMYGRVRHAVADVRLVWRDVSSG